MTTGVGPRRAGAAEFAAVDALDGHCEFGVPPQGVFDRSARRRGSRRVGLPLVFTKDRASPAIIKTASVQDDPCSGACRRRCARHRRLILDATRANNGVQQCVPPNVNLAQVAKIFGQFVLNNRDHAEELASMPAATVVILRSLQRLLPAEAAGECRHVTVMFCDLVDSTGIASKLDAEDWRDLVGAYLDAATAGVTEMGGKVAKKLGDGLMALFGYPVAQENDAERAVRAALSIQRALVEFNHKDDGTGIIWNLWSTGTSERGQAWATTKQSRSRFWN
jgi:hypothetical protein